MVSGEGGFHEMYTEVEDVLWAVVGIGLPVGAVSKAREASISKNVRKGRSKAAKNFDCQKVGGNSKIAN